MDEGPEELDSGSRLWNKKVHPARVICVEDRHPKNLEDETARDALFYVFHGGINWSFPCASLECIFFKKSMGLK
jgi:hypothetical protein